MLEMCLLMQVADFGQDIFYTLSKNYPTDLGKAFEAIP